MILNENFNPIHTIDDLSNPDYPINYYSKIQLLNIKCKIFHYNLNIALLQMKINNKNLCIFDKTSYSIVDSFKTDHKLIAVLKAK